MNRIVSVACRGLTWVAALVLLVGCIPFCLPVQAETAFPLVVVVEGGTEVTAVSCEGAPTFFLPGYINRSAVTVKNVGAGTLYFPTLEIKIKVGKTAKLNLASDMVDFEYTSDSKVQGRFFAQIEKGSNKVPSLYISLGADTTLAELHKSKENKGSGSLVMLDHKGQTVYNGALETIKGRGNTSFTHPGLAPDKKSYNIKLDKKTELVPGAGKAKKWALIHMRVDDSFMVKGTNAVGYDWTGLCNLLGYQTYSAMMGEGYADVKARFVDLYIDGEYRGVYILAERVDVNAAVEIYDAEEYVDSKSDEYTLYASNNDPAMKAGVKYYQYTADAVKKPGLDISGGYLLEVNTPNLQEPCGFETERGMLVDIKAPEVCTKEQVSYIAAYFQQFEDALYADSGVNNEGRHYSEYVDMDSLVGLLVTDAFFKNWELFRTSTYMYLDTASSNHPKLTFGPAWDFETGAYMLKNDATLYNKHQLYGDTESQCYNILGQLATKGDVQQKMYEKQQQLNKIMNATLNSGSYQGITNANALWRDAMDSLEMNWLRWGYEAALDRKGGIFKSHENTYSYYAKEFVSALKIRWSNWKKLWDEDRYLLGVTIKKQAADSNVLTAEVSGVAKRYQWYRLTDGNQLEEIPRATKSAYVVRETGVYCCAVSGNHNAFHPDSLSEILSEQTIVMFSQPIRIHVADRSPTGTTTASGGTTAPSREETTSTVTESTTATVPAEPQPTVPTLPPSMQEAEDNKARVAFFLTEVMPVVVPVITLAFLWLADRNVLLHLLQKMMRK